MAADTGKGNTPIADAFACNRAVMGDAMALIRKLETDRAELVQIAALLAGTACTEGLTKAYPLDKLEFP